MSDLIRAIQTIKDSDFDAEELKSILGPQLEERSRQRYVKLDLPFSTSMGTPDDEQMGYIESMLGNKTSPEDWYVVPIRASDNLVDRSMARWHLNILNQFGFGFPGKSLIVNHSARDVQKSFGFIGCTKLVKQDDCPDIISNAIGLKEYNKKIIKKEGYNWVYMMGVIQADHSVSMDVQMRRYHDVSTGSYLSNVRTLCPNCEEELGREVDFYEKDKEGNYICPHMPPTPWNRWLASYFGDDDINWSDYYILDGASDEVELSFCVEGALPAASVLREGAFLTT